MSEEIAAALCKTTVISTGDFKLASGRNSNIYINLRMLPSYPEVFNFISDKAAEAISSMEVNVIAGTEAAIPIATAVALKTGLPMITVRKPRQFNNRSLVTGVIDREQKVVLITDIITNGYNKIRQIEAIKNEGGIIENLLTVLDKEEGAAESLEQKGVKLQSLITLKSLLDYMKAHSMMDEETYSKIIEQQSQEKEYE